MASRITLFLRFSAEQDGVLPPDLAAEYLGVSRAALNKLAIKRLAFKRVLNTRYYGVKSLRDYKWWKAALYAPSKAVLSD